MSRKQIQTFTPETRLDQIGLPFIEVILTERFLLPPDSLRRIGEAVPTTIADVAALSGMPLAAIYSVLSECVEIGQDIFMVIPDLTAAAADDGTIVVDMRPDINEETEPLHPAARLFHSQNPQQILPFLRTMTRVLVLSQSPDHAWSAAMGLRKMRIPAWVARPRDESDL